VVTADKRGGTPPKYSGSERTRAKSAGYKLAGTFGKNDNPEWPALKPLDLSLYSPKTTKKERDEAKDKK
jgi:hypothetical protein